MKFDKQQAEAILKFLNTATWEGGVKHSVDLVTAYKWLSDYLSHHATKEEKPKTMGEPKKAIKE
jgi:hypothetical protein